MSDNDRELLGATTATNHDMKPLTLADIVRARRDLNYPPKPVWILVAPDGRVWMTSKPGELFAVLAPHHPLLKSPSLGELLKD